ncbi:hypothetical protein V2G26_006010 [Clonostachys chloroleuca]
MLSTINCLRAKARFSGPRKFSTTRQCLTELKINSERLQETLHYTCQWGAANRYGEEPTETGMSRLALSDEDAQVRRWFRQETERLGCKVTIDQMGNMFARRPGALHSSAPMTAMGSHLDTQPRGGRYDGILGVVAAVEVLRTMEENGYQTQYDVGIVNWTNEEGARFPKSMVSSAVWAGDIPIVNAWALQDISDPSVTMKSELERHGYLGEVRCSSDPVNGYPLGAHFELHIEQGPILEQTAKKIGVVTGTQGYRWFTFILTGRNAHTGTTPFGMRRDPLLAASKMIASSNAIAKKFGGLASTGILKMPIDSSTNTVPSEISFSLDIRHPDDRVVAAIEQSCLQSFRDIAQEDGAGVAISWTLDTDSPAAVFDKQCISAVEQAASSLVGPDGWLHIASGAGHDSVGTNKRCPTTMIFVPCKDGVSHHPEEYCSQEDCAIGTQVLLDSILIYDGIRKSRVEIPARVDI